MSIDKIPLIIENIVEFAGYEYWIELARVNRMFKVCCQQQFKQLTKRQRKDFRVYNFHKYEVAWNNLDYHCKKGHLLVAKWLTTRFDITPEYIKNGNMRVFREACEGDLVIVKWLTSRFNLTAVDGDYRRYGVGGGLSHACMKGNLDIVKWLTKQFDLTVDDVRANYNQAFRWACYGGHLLVVQWLIEKFDLTVNDMTISNPDNTHHSGEIDALLGACRDGHLELAQWLTKKFNLMADDPPLRALFRTRIISMTLLQYICGRGHLAVARLLTIQYNLTADEARANWALYLACREGHLTVVQWLMEHFHLTIDDAAYGLQTSCEYGYLDVARWLIDHFKLTRKDIKKADRNNRLNLR